MSGTNANSIARVYDSLQGRNRIINGACNVAQRGSFVASTGLNGYGGPDRFVCNNANSAGGQFTQAQGTITIGGVTKNAVAQTVNTAISSTTGTNVWVGIDQNIEGFNCYDLLGQQVSISFIFNTNVTGTYSLSLRDYTAVNSYVTTFTATANTPARYTFLIPTLPTTLVVPASTAGGLSLCIGGINTGTFQTSTLGSWQSGNFVTASGATNWGASSSNFIAATEIQLEQGTIATPFEREPISTTYTKCYRYYQTGIASIGLSVSGTYLGAFNNYSVPMRTTPTYAYASAISPFAASQIGYNNGGSGGSTTISSGGFNNNPNYWYVDANMVATTTNWWRWTWTSTAEL